MQQVTDQMSLVAQDKAAIAADQAMVKTAELNVAYTHIVSPVTGRVGLRLVDPGNYLQPSDASGIVVITQIDPISVVFTTPESNLQRISARLSTGAKLPVTVLNRDNTHPLATGTLTTFDSQIDVTTGTIRMRSTFDNPKGVLFPNQFVNVRLLVDTMTGATLAPNAAIQLGASGDFVYLLKDDSTVAKRDVAVGPDRWQTHRDHFGARGRRQGGDRRRRPAARRREGQNRRPCSCKRAARPELQRVPPEDPRTAPGSIISTITTSRAQRTMPRRRLPRPILRLRRARPLRSRRSALGPARHRRSRGRFIQRPAQGASTPNGAPVAPAQGSAQ